MKVLTVSRFFPAYHPRKGEPTAFPEKIMAYLADKVPNWTMKDDFVLYDWHTYYNCTNPKLHTIRAGNRWNEGEWASLKVWSGRPYHSRPVEFAQVQLKKIYPFELTDSGYKVNGVDAGFDALSCLAENDGLTIDDFECWFAGHGKKKNSCFTGQILCWGDVNY